MVQNQTGLLSGLLITKYIPQHGRTLKPKKLNGWNLRRGNEAITLGTTLMHVLTDVFPE